LDISRWHSVFIAYKLHQFFCEANIKATEAAMLRTRVEADILHQIRLTKIKEN